MDKHLVVVSRKWHEPFIRVSITDLDLKVVMSLEDFAVALSTEIGANPAKVSEAFQKVVDGMKRETSKVF